MSAFPLQAATMRDDLVWRQRLVKADLEVIRRIVSRTKVFNEEEVDVAVELAEDRLKRGAESDYHFLFAERDARVIAYSCYGRIPFTDARFDLYWIAAEPLTQTQGIASALLTMTEAAITARGGKRLYAETSSRAIYAPAHAFYHKNGFTCESVFKDFYKDGDDKLVFVKKL